jgi:hypothetical protein
MMKTITATFENKAALANAVDDLINDGQPSERIYRDDQAMLVKVMTSDATESEVNAILSRHHPKEMH